MIEAIEVHETRVTETVKIKLERPICTGVALGIGFILAPLVLIGVMYLIILVIMLAT